MPAAQLVGQVAPDVLELIRKTVFGGNHDSSSFDFTNLFGPLGNPLGQSNNPASLSQLVEGINTGGGPANNASGTASPSGLAAVSAIGSVVANAVMSAVNPLAPTVANAAAHTPSTLSALQSLVEAVFHPDAFNASIDTNAPESANANDAGLAQAADSQAANITTDAGDDGSTDGSGDGSSAGGTGTSAGNAGDADGGSGPGDSGDGGDSGSFFTGGLVPGPPTGQDKTNINVDGGEWVVPSHIVDMLGKNFFEDLMLTKSPLQVAAEKEAAKMSKGVK